MIVRAHCCHQEGNGEGASLFLHCCQEECMHALSFCCWRESEYKCMYIV